MGAGCFDLRRSCGFQSRRAIFLLPVVSGCLLGLAMAGRGVSAPVAAAQSPEQPGAGSVRRGTIGLADVSGAAQIRGDRLLLVSGARNAITLLQSPAARLLQGRVAVDTAEFLEPGLRGKLELDDLEDAAWDGMESAFLVTSHARTPGGESPEQRYRLARLRFDPTGKLLEARQSGALLQAVVQDVPFLADSIRRTPARSGLNIEGLAWTAEGHLLVGLRAPTITESAPRPHGGQEDAVVVRVKNPDSLFSEPAGAAELGDVVKLDLRGQGIRGMCYDPDRKATWLLSGLSAEPTHSVKSPWALWLWDEKAAPQEVRLPEGVDLESPEAVCRLDIEGRPTLLLIDGGKPASRYVLLPAADLKPSPP